MNHALPFCPHVFHIEPNPFKRVHSVDYVFSLLYGYRMSILHRYGIRYPEDRLPFMPEEAE
jgi:hypothetical protein